MYNDLRDISLRFNLLELEERSIGKMIVDESTVGRRTK